METKRKAAVAGYFYPDNPEDLEQEIERLFKRVPDTKMSGAVRAFISPHAGYIYSGFTAAHAYKLLKGTSFDTVILVGPSHREYFDGISIYPGEAYVTPLGEVRIDDEMRVAISKNMRGLLLSDVGHRLEHSIEVQLPFLQYVMPKTKFVPIVMGDQRRQHCLALAEAMSKACTGGNVLMIASSDLSHYHPYDEANVLDRVVVNLVEAGDAESLMRKLETDEAEACGGGPMVVIMLASLAMGATKPDILHHCNSGDVTGNKDTVVGYLSAAFLQAH
jgi:hypothetical protein